jgi:5S rRNA maturation endonuclease (ribonuclease M5)
VNTNQINPERLRKVLALVDSDKEGEALAAFQMAKRLLAKGGMSF